MLCDQEGKSFFTVFPPVYKRWSFRGGIGIHMSFLNSLLNGLRVRLLPGAFRTNEARVVELVDTLDLGSSAISVRVRFPPLVF